MKKLCSIFSKYFFYDNKQHAELTYLVKRISISFQRYQTFYYTTKTWKGMSKNKKIARLFDTNFISLYQLLIIEAIFSHLRVPDKGGESHVQSSALYNWTEAPGISGSIGKWPEVKIGKYTGWLTKKTLDV